MTDAQMMGVMLVVMMMMLHRVDSAAASIGKQRQGKPDRQATRQDKHACLGAKRTI
jgi:hypothetical protein